MRKVRFQFVLAILLLTTATYTAAQNNLPAVYQIKTDTGTRNNLDFKYWQYLEDPSQKLTIAQVSSPVFDGRFRSLDVKQMAARKARTCWYRYHFQNLAGHQVKLMLPAIASVSDLYRYDTIRHQWQVARNGTDVPWSKRAGLKKEPYFSCTLQAGEQLLLYERAVDAGNSPSILRDYSFGYYNDVVQKYYIDESSSQYEIPMSVLTGVLLLAGLINLIFFGIVRERFYLYFGLYALFAAFSNFLGSTHVLFREHPGAIAAISVLATALSTGFNVAFTRIYLRTREIFRRIDRWLVISLVVFFVFQLVVLFFVENLPLALANVIKLTTLLVLTLINLLITITLASMLIRRLPGARIKALIVGPLNVFPFLLFAFLLVNIIALLTHMTKGLWDSTNWLRDNYNNMTLFAGSWLIIGMSVVLFKRFQDLQNKIAYDALDKERVLREQEEERNQLIARQNEALEMQVAERTAKLSASLTELKATQGQLIQSAKMASLGELTAGIAHEIQNPLNFVNNFSDVNQEMIAEAEEELKAGNLEDVLAILADIKSNETKINHHGKRADGIVKGMLEHSRTASGSKELTDLNKLTDEYLRLAYHGFRAKNSTFSAAMIKYYADQLPLGRVIPQEIGRVLLNLFNNAFYALREHANTEPAITITTRVKKAVIQISVRDNGPGIPADVIEKIMQPFFTTKPTGQGTGLGLSLSYDIIVKSHGGSLLVNSTVGTGTELIIELPV